MVLFVYVAYVPHLSSQPLDVLTLRTASAAEEHIGWLLAIVVQLLLAFYVAVSGGQLLGEVKQQERTRRLLGVVAQVLAALAVPLALVLFAAALLDSGYLVVSVCVVIAMVAVVFLAVQLGTFVVPDPAIQLQFAREERARVEELRRRFAPRPWPGWSRVAVTLAVNVILILGIALLPSVWVWWGPPSYFGYMVSRIGIIVIVSSAAWYATVYLIFRGSRFQAVVSMVISGLLTGGALVIAASGMSDSRAVPVLLSAVVGVLAPVVSACLSRLSRTGPLTIGSVAATVALYVMNGRIAQLDEQIEKLETQQPGVGWGQRFKAAWRAWSRGSLS